MERHHWISVGAAIYDHDSDSFLLIQRDDNGRWELPGGLLERREHLVAGAIREVREETGVQIAVDGVSGIYQSFDGDVVSVVFASRYLTGELSTSSESRAVRWVSRSEVPLIVPRAYACRLLDIFEPRVPLRITDDLNVYGDALDGQ